MDHLIRSKGVGGSEIATLLGVNPYQSPYQLWLIKTGREKNPPMNKFMEAGTILESAIAQFYHRRTKNEIIDPEDATLIHDKYPFVIGTPDRYFKGPNGSETGVLECKSTQMTVDDPPASWFCQLQWYMGITGLTHGSIAWLTRGVDFGFKDYNFDEDFFRDMVEAADKFWNENVKKDIQPDPMVIGDYEAIYSKSIDGLIKEADETSFDSYTRLKEIKAEMAKLKADEKECVDAIKIFMEDSDTLMHNGSPLVTWRSPKVSMMFDSKRFGKEHPDMYEQFLVEKANSRRFLTK